MDAPIVNVVIQSPRETTRRDKSFEMNSSGQERDLSSVHAHEKPKKSQTGNIKTKFGDYNVQDVKVQISLSRLDNHATKVFSGIWKPDVSTIHRLQGN